VSSTVCGTVIFTVVLVGLIRRTHADGRDVTPSQQKLAAKVGHESFVTPDLATDDQPTLGSPPSRLLITDPRPSCSALLKHTPSA